MLVLTIAKDLDELFQNGGLAAITFLSISGRVMVMTVDTAIVFIVTVLSPKNCGTNGTSEVFDVIFPIQSSYVRAPQSSSTSETQEIQSPKVICFAKWILMWWLFGNREEFRSNNLSTFLL